MNRLISISLVCLLQVSLTFASTYNLRVEVTPHGSGTLNINEGNYEEGSRISLRTYSNTGYVFKGWYEDDLLISSSTSFSYTMPSNDVLVQARYEYDPTVPANPAMPDTTIYYTLSATVSPIGAGTLNTYSGKYAANATVTLRAYVNTGYTFVGWQNEEGEIISSSASFNYRMPSCNSQLTALYVYDPSVPANPDSMATRYTVTVACKPVGGGTFNTTSAIMEEGGSVYLKASPNTGYKFLHWENENGETISTAQGFNYVIPHGNSTVYGVFEYDPSLPDGPNKNFWDEATGEVIVDDFTPGNLYSAIKAVIGGSSASYRDKVKKIIVAGQMSSSDFGTANNFANCSIVDISRTYGYTEIPSYAYDYNTSLQHILLPACVTTIGYRAFYQCTNLAEISCYAEIPPTVDEYAFYGIADRVVVHVPYSSIQSYSEAEGWKSFVIESFSVEPTIEDFTFTDNLDVTYNGQPYEFPISSVPGMGKISVRYTDTLGVESTEGPTAIGKYYVSIDVEKGEYFSEASFDNIASFTIYVMDEVEWTALQELYHATRGGSAWKEKWNIEGGIAAAASFHGITFEKGHIVALDLSNNNLQDSLPTTKMQLPYLRELNISSNKLTGNIGSITQSCPQLAKLLAQNNLFTEVYPMLAASIAVSLERQTIVEPLIFNGTLSYAPESYSLIPTILSYSHKDQKYVNPDWSVYNQDGTYWVSMKVNADNGSIEWAKSYAVYYGNSGDTLEVRTSTPKTSVNSQAKMVFYFAQGDADLSGETDVLDLQSTINFIFKEYQNYPFNHTAANLQSKDSHIDVLDVIALVDLLLGNTASTESLSPSRVRANMSTDTEAYLYWEGNRLILETAKDIAALDMALQGGNALQWNESLDMTVVSSEKDTHQRIIGYSMSGKYIPQGKHVLLTATAPCEVTTALMADRTAQEVEVALKAPEHTTIKSIAPAQVKCRYQHGWLQLCVDGAWEDMQWEVYATDGRLLGKGRLSERLKGYKNILPVGSQNLVIIIVRSNDKIVLKQKINTTK